MNTIEQYEKVCLTASRGATRAYSTSFSLGIRALHHSLRDPIHAIYGFVRFADEIVDTFHGHDKASLLARFRKETDLAVQDGISLNPILHSFQRVVHHYGIERDLYITFLESMAMDLEDRDHDERSYDKYILGSAEVVGAMCLRVFCEGDRHLYDRLVPLAMKLGAAFQKVNFLRDLQDDQEQLGRTYFPELRNSVMDEAIKHRIEADIQEDLDRAIIGIRQLPKQARFGVYLAYRYYKALFKRIKALPYQRVLQERIRVPDRSKFALFTTGFVRHHAGLI